jgi:hypothetical protein
MIRYEVTKRLTNEVLYSTDDRERALEQVLTYVDRGQSWDDLDVIGISDSWRKSLLGRSYESPLRSTVSQSREVPYLAFRTLGEAKDAAVAAVILEGDWGGQIFATCPAGLVRCTEERLRRLAGELETAIHVMTFTGSAKVVFEPLPIGAEVAGGMGGGIITNGVWSHEQIRQLGWAEPVARIVLATQDELPTPVPDVPADVRRGMLRAYDEQIDVFWDVFGFDPPDYLGTLDDDELRRREESVVRPPINYTRWYDSTYRAVVQGRDGNLDQFDLHRHAMFGG